MSEAGCTPCFQSSSFVDVVSRASSGNGCLHLNFWYCLYQSDLCHYKKNDPTQLSFKEVCLGSWLSLGLSLTGLLGSNNEKNVVE